MRVLLVVIDAATPHVVCPAIRTGRLPLFARLADAGDLHERSVSIFPSITPAATTSIVTGAYPAEHGIAGASWFDEAREEVAYYGDDFWVIARRGFGDFLRDFLLRLNGDRLTAPTVFEMAERSGRIAASLNYLVFRGNHPHPVRVPHLMAAIPGVPRSDTVEGPTLLYLGDFVGDREEKREFGGKRGLLHRFGMDDAATGALLKDLFSRDRPDLTVAYFADNDFRSHEVGPHAALPVIERVDRMMADAFEAAGGLERVLADTCVIVTSDHGHCDVRGEGAGAAIRLDRLLGNFRQAALGRGWRPGDEVLICPNMRAAQLYFRSPGPDRIEQAARDMLADPRVDQVMWRTSLMRPDAEGFTVASGRGRLEFGRPSNDTPALRDAFGGSWRFQGDAAALDFEVERDTIEYRSYPNAFERIAGALDLDQNGDLWVTAVPGCEFEVPGGAAHVGGASHGALHALDSLSPVLVAGGATRHKLPRAMRSVDIAPMCMQMLGLPMRYLPGVPRGGRAPTTSGRTRPSS
jgi:hypothetical protein